MSFLRQSVSYNDLSLWGEQFKYIPPSFKQSMTNFTILLRLDDKCDLRMIGIIMSTYQNKTYIYGEEACKWVLLVHNPNSPQLMEELNDKTINQLEYGKFFFAILTQDGEVYCAGRLGLTETNKGLKKLKLGDKKIKQISCGFNKLLLLCENGDVLETRWVTKYRRCETNRMVNVKNVIQVACGSNHCLVLTDKHEVYSWGSNYGGQLGLNHNNFKSAPTLIKFFNNSLFPIVDIAAGTSHCLYLLKNKLVFFNGLIDYPKDYNFINIKLNFEESPIRMRVGLAKAIMSRWYTSFSMALTVKNECYVWGLLNKKKITDPCKMPKKVRSFSHASSFFFDIPYTFGWTSIEDRFDFCKTFQYQAKLNRKVQSFFDNAQNHDFVLNFENGKKIYAKKQYLCDVSDYLQSMLSKDWCKEDSIEIKTYSYDVFYAYIKLLHYGTTDITDEILPGLIDLASCYTDKELLDLCEDYMVQNLKYDNHERYDKMAVVYNLQSVKSKIQRLYDL